MFIIGNSWQTLFEQFKAADQDKKDQIMRLSRTSYYELCRATSWVNMRNDTPYVYDEDIDGMWLPSNLIDIDAVATSEYLYLKSDAPRANLKFTGSRQWFISEFSRVALLSGTGMKISNGSTTFTGATDITTEHVGEYIRIGGQSGFYKIAGAGTLATPYYGKKQVNAAWQVRPVNTQKIKLVDETGAADKTEATIYFSEFPEQLHDENQQILLPSAEILELTVAIRMFRITGNLEAKNSASSDLYGSKGRYEGKLDKAISLNPNFIPPCQPQNRRGRNAGYGAGQGA